MAIRYTQKKKDEVVAFIQKYNAENGRGGQSAACAKYVINPITIRSWMDKAGVPAPGKRQKKIKTSKGTGTRKVTLKETSTVSALRRMAEIQEEIERLSCEFDLLKSNL